MTLLLLTPAQAGAFASSCDLLAAAGASNARLPNPAGAEAMSEEKKKPDNSADLERVWGLLEEWGHIRDAIGQWSQYEPSDQLHLHQSRRDKESALRAAITALAKPADAATSVPAGARPAAPAAEKPEGQS